MLRSLKLSTPQAEFCVLTTLLENKEYKNESEMKTMLDSLGK
jgi:hypothetical protein